MNNQNEDQKNEFNLYLTGPDKTEVVLQVKTCSPEAASKIYEGLEALLLNILRIDLENEWGRK